MKRNKKGDSENQAFYAAALALGIFLVIGACVFIGSRTFPIVPFIMKGDSMAPEILAEDRIFLNRWVYLFQKPKRGDVILFRYPLVPKVTSVKRVAGLPGDKIQIKDGNLYVNGERMNTKEFPIRRFYRNREDGDYGKTGQTVEVPEDSYYVLGDFSLTSSDSRIWGFVPRKDILGKALCIWWPPRRAQKIR